MRDAFEEERIQASVPGSGLKAFAFGNGKTLPEEKLASEAGFGQSQDLVTRHALTVFVGECRRCRLPKKKRVDKQ